MARTRPLGVAAVVLFAVLGVWLALHPTPGTWERGVDDALRASSGTATFSAFRTISWFGSAMVVAVAAIVLAVRCWRSNARRLGVVCFAAPLVAGIVETTAKPVVGRTRPATAVLGGEGGYGFPSGHAAGSMALAGVTVLVILRFVRRGRLRATLLSVAVVYVLLIGASRLVIGVHHALDVVGGWLVGAAVVLLLTPFAVDRGFSDGSAVPWSDHGHEQIHVSSGPRAEQGAGGDDLLLDHQDPRHDGR